MVTIYKDGTKVKILIEHGIFYNDAHFELEINQSQPYQAKLLSDAMNNNLERQLNRLKEKYYMQGWKDAKAKRKKQTAFYGKWEK